jgi:quinoprotein glucose dehydrogenase
MPDETSLPHYPEIRMWSMRIFGFVILIFGAVLGIGGVKLASLGGSLYYLLVGITLILSGALTIAGRVAGLYVYSVAFLATLVWSLFEAGLDGWALVPRLVGPFILLVIALLVMPARLLNGKPTRRAYGAGLTVILALGLLIAVPLDKAPVSP